MGGGGWGGALAVLQSLSRPSPAPREWRQHSKTCSGVLVPYTRHKLDTAGNSGRGPPAPRLRPGSAGRGSQGPHSHGVEEGQVLGAFDGQLPGGVVVDDLWDTVERGAVLTQDVFLFGFGQFHVHEALVALQGEGVVMPAGLAVPDKVATLLTEAQQVLSVAPADGSVIPYLLLQWHSRIHSLSQDPTELRAPMFDGLEAPSGSSKLAPPVPGR